MHIFFYAACTTVPQIHNARKVILQYEQLQETYFNVTAQEILLLKYIWLHPS